MKVRICNSKVCAYEFKEDLSTINLVFAGMVHFIKSGVEHAIDIAENR